MLCWALPGQLLCGDFYHATTFWVDSSVFIGRLVTSLPDLGVFALMQRRLGAVNL